MLRGLGIFLRRIAIPNYQNNPVEQMHLQLGKARASQVKHDKLRLQFFVELEGEKAILQYKIIDKDTLDFRTTNVPEIFQGMGIAKKLAKAAFDHCVKNDLKIKLSCAFLKKYYKENPIPGYASKVTIGKDD